MLSFIPNKRIENELNLCPATRSAAAGRTPAF